MEKFMEGFRKEAALDVGPKVGLGTLAAVIGAAAIISKLKNAREPVAVTEAEMFRQPQFARDPVYQHPMFYGQDELYRLRTSPYHMYNRDMYRGDGFRGDPTNYHY